MFNIAPVPREKEQRILLAFVIAWSIINELAHQNSCNEFFGCPAVMSDTLSLHFRQWIFLSYFKTL